MKLQVGILSMQKVINYGSLLQAYALKKIIESLGADVFFIDIKSGEVLPGLEKKKIEDNGYKRFVRAIGSGKFFEKVSSNRFRKCRDRKFQLEFIKILDAKKDVPERYDVIVIGSDEVFNACNPATWGFTTQLFGEGLSAKRIVSYAASFGHTGMDDIDKFGIGPRIKNALKNLSMISVRDRNSYEIISRLTREKPQLHFDPVLIYDWPEIELSPVKMSGYIVVYAYNNRITVQERNEIIAFARENNKKLVSLYEYNAWCDKNIIPKTPFEILTYFKNADYIVTDTFHGTIFSVINKRPFCTIIRDSNKNKLEHLLEQVHQIDRRVKSDGDLCYILSKPPEFGKTEETLLKCKVDTIHYLKSCMSSL